MKTLITGVPGWLGNRLLKILTDPNEVIYSKFNKHPDREIICIVLPSLIKNLPKIKNVTYIPADITKPETLKGKLEGVDVIYHLAGIIHPKNVKEFYSINTYGTENLLSEAIQAKVKRFILISSNSVAGLNKDQKLFDENCPYNPYLNYGKSKMLAEQKVLEAGKKNKIETTIFRFCWFYGPNQPARQTRFFNMILKGNPIIFGNGENLRSMSYVDNSIQALLLAETNQKAINQTYWVSDNNPYKTINIYRTVANILEVKNLKPRFLPNITSSICYIIDVILQRLGLYIQEFHVAGEMNKSIACSIEKAKNELGYFPEVSLEEGMRRSITWCKENGRL